MSKNVRLYTFAYSLFDRTPTQITLRFCANPATGCNQNIIGGPVLVPPPWLRQWSRKICCFYCNAIDLRESTPSLCSRRRWLQMWHCERHALNFSKDDDVQMYLAQWNSAIVLIYGWRPIQVPGFLAGLISRFKVDGKKTAAKATLSEEATVFVWNAAIDARRPSAWSSRNHWRKRQGRKIASISNSDKWEWRMVGGLRFTLTLRRIQSEGKGN